MTSELFFKSAEAIVLNYWQNERMCSRQAIVIIVIIFKTSDARWFGFFVGFFKAKI